MHGGIAQGVAAGAVRGGASTTRTATCTTSSHDAVPRAVGGRAAAHATLDRTETPCPTNPLGVKGIGEAGTIAAPPAVVNAVVDALSPLGVDRHRHARHARAGLASDPRAAKGGAHDPGRVRLRACRVGRRRRSRLLGEHGEDAKLLAGGHSLLPLMKLRLARPAVLVDIGRLPDLVLRPRRRRRTSRSARSRGTTTSRADDLLGQRLPDRVATRPGRSATRRCATAARSAARSPTAIRRPTCRRCCSRSAPRSWRPGPAASGRSPADEFFTGVLRDGARPARGAHRDPRAEAGRAGWAYLKFNRRAQDWAIVGRRGRAGERRRARRRWSNMGSRRCAPPAWRRRWRAGADPATAAARPTRARSRRATRSGQRSTAASCRRCS